MNSLPQLALDFSRGKRNVVSQESHAKLRKLADYERIMIRVHSAPLGLTCEEAAAAMTTDQRKVESHHISGRFSEMGKNGFQWLHVIGTRLNKSGNKCSVYELTESGKEKLAYFLARRGKA